MSLLNNEWREKEPPTFFLFDKDISDSLFFFYKILDGIVFSG